MCASKPLTLIQIQFFVIFVCVSATLNTSQQNTAANKTHFKSIESLLSAIQNEHTFSTIVLWWRAPEDCFTELSNWSSTNYAAQLIFNSNYTVYLNAHFNRAILNVVCLDDFMDLSLLDNMADGLQHMREARILFLLKNNFTTEPQDDLEELFTYCDQQQMLNVLAVSEYFAATGIFYTFNRFPNFNVEYVQWPSTYYPNRIDDLCGYELQTMPSQAEPGSIVYTDSKGNKHSSGYIYHLISTYATKLNGSLTYRLPLNVGASIEMSVLADLTSNYKLDLPICLQMPVENISLYKFSGIVETSNWMPMLPRRGFIAYNQIYKHLFSNSTLIIDVIIFFIFSLLYGHITNGEHGQSALERGSRKLSYIESFFNDKIFRAVIGLSFHMRHERNYTFYLLYFLIFLQGLIWSTVYNAQLNAFISHPPADKEINSYDDLKASDTKIVIPQEQFELLKIFMSDSFLRKYRDTFLIIAELRDFHTLRKSLDTNFAYSVDSQIWEMIARLQQSFAQRLFRVSEDLQFHRHILWAVPLAENSVYRASFNAYLLDMQAYGFWNHWTAMSLFEMIEAGKLSFKDITKPLAHKALKVWDLYYIWLIYIVGTVFGCFCFIAEVLYKKLIRETMVEDDRRFFKMLWREIRNRFS